MRARENVAASPLELPPPGQKIGYLGVVVAAASWGTWCVFLRQAAGPRPLAPQLSALVVLATVFLVTSPFALRATQRQTRVRSRRDWWLLAAFGVSDALNCVLYFSALQTTSVAVAVLTHYAAPLFVALGAPLLLGEPRHPRTLVSALLGVIGLMLLLAPWGVPLAAGPQLLTGTLLGLGSAVFYATSLLFNKRLSASFDASEMLVYHMPSALILLALLVPHGGWAISDSALTWLVLGALGPGALAGVIFMRSLARVPAAHASVLTLIEPVIALLIAALAWGEELQPLGLIGGAAILAAGYLVVR
jgi:drug/metabolite transporter (DMT)-like permease